MKRVPLIRIGLSIAASPILIAFIASLFQGGSMFNEGTGTGAYLWLLMLTLPIGGIAIVIGVIRIILRRLTS
jgi:nitrate reductase gamma subunit